MTETRSSLLQSLTERGFLHQCTDLEGLDKLALEGPVSADAADALAAAVCHALRARIRISVLRAAGRG